MSATTFIYALCEPGTKTIRYFGKANNPKDRFWCHLANLTGCRSWICSLQQNGKNPEMQVLCEVPRKDFSRFEKAFVTLGRQHGMDLINSTDGGDGLSGWSKKK